MTHTKAVVKHRDVGARGGVGVVEGTCDGSRDAPQASQDR